MSNKYPNKKMRIKKENSIMSGSTFGNIFQITTWGESHGSGIGVVVDGCPAGLSLSEADIQTYLDRRKPGASRYATQRKEADSVEILSGIFEGKTTGTPISMLVRNTSQRSADYSEIASYYRPGHADYTFDQKYGFRDYRGGGRSSGRETIGRVAAGAIAAKLLAALGITVTAYTQAIGAIELPNPQCPIDQLDLEEARKTRQECRTRKLPPKRKNISRNVWSGWIPLAVLLPAVSKICLPV